MNLSNKYYLTTNKLVSYSGLSLRTIRSRIKAGLLAPVKENGKLLFHYMQLPNESAREAFLRDRGQLPSQSNERNNTDLIYLKSWQRAELERRENIVQGYIEVYKDVPRRKKTAFKNSYAKQHGINKSTLERIVKAFNEGGRLALIPGWNSGEQVKIIDRAIAKTIQDIYLKPFGPSIKETYERLCETIKDKYSRLPSYRTIANHIHRTWTKAEQLFIRNKDEFDRLYSPHVRRDWDKVEVNEVWFGDAKQIDVACIFRNKIIFPWLTAFLDARSRKFVGWILTPVHDSWAIAQAFVYGVSAHGVPGTIYIDLGKPYRSHMIAGTKRKKDAEKNPVDEFQETSIPGIIRDLGAVIFFAAPYNAKEKIIEPAFKVFTQRQKHLPGYRGHSTKTRPKKLQQEMKSGNLLSFDDLSIEVDRVLNERNSRPHSTTGEAPNLYYENFTPVIPSESVLAYLLMDVKLTAVKDSSVYIDRMLYRHDELWHISGETVEVRRDPKDLSRAAIIRQGKVFCIAALETPDHYRSEVTLENVKTCRRIRKKMSVWRKAILEGEELLNNPERLEKEGTVRGRDIRPAASKVRSLHQKERLAKETIEGLQNHEPAPGAEKRQTVAVGEEDIIWEALRNASQFRAEKETQEPELRLVQHSTLDEY